MGAIAIVDSIMEQGCWPPQVLVAVLVLLPKKQSGTRTIGILPTLVRLVLASYSADMRTWDKAIALPGDSAAPGVCSQIAVGVRALRSEVAAERGSYTAQLLWDFEAYFDSLDMQESIASLKVLSAPLPGIALALQTHKCERWLRSGPSYAKTIGCTGRGILAGCTTSTTIARAYAFETARVSMDHGVPAFQHVDDLSHVIIDSTVEGLIAKTVEVASTVAQVLKKKKLRIANKRGGAEVLACSNKIAGVIVRKLRRLGLPFNATKEAEDLGIGASCGQRRNKNTTLKRIKKAAERIKKVKLLQSTDASAKKLIKTNIDPCQSYGCSIAGADQRTIRALQRNVVEALGGFGRSPCHTTVIA